jgi:hypothetical protein
VSLTGYTGSRPADPTSTLGHRNAHNSRSANLTGSNIAAICAIWVSRRTSYFDFPSASAVSMDLFVEVAAIDSNSIACKVYQNCNLVSLATVALLCNVCLFMYCGLRIAFFTVLDGSSCVMVSLIPRTAVPKIGGLYTARLVFTPNIVHC